VSQHVTRLKDTAWWRK